MIDVSSYQGRINWKQVYKEGIRRAYIKATEGLNYVDPWFKTNAKNARSAGVQIGFYHFAHPSNSPLAEARYFLHNIHPFLHDGDLPPCLDLEVEQGKSWTELGLWKARWYRPVDHFIGTLAMFYSDLSFYQDMNGGGHPLNPKRPLWIADYTHSRPDAAKEWFAWQYTSKGKIGGIKGLVDLSRVINPLEKHELVKVRHYGN